MKLTFKINKPVDFVFDYLKDMQKFVSVHPIISKIDSKGGNRYLVYETLKMCFIPFSFTYPVSVESNFKDKTIVMKATVMKFTKIEMTFNVKPDGASSIIEEEINFISLLPFKYLIQLIFKKQHTELFKNIGDIKD
jgi:carbon monoxide dehydrogenase subunit G